MVDRVQNSLGSGLTLLIDYGFRFNWFETFTIFRVQFYWVSKNPSSSGQVFEFSGF